MIINGWSYSTGAPSATRMLTTLPACGATMSLKVFIASTSSSLSPAFTTDPSSTNGLASGLGPQIGCADHRRFHRAREIGRRRARCRRRDGGARAGLAATGGRLRNRGYVRGSRRRSLARQTHLQVSEADLDLAQIVLRHDLCELVDRSDVDETLRRPVGLRAGRLLHCLSLARGNGRDRSTSGLSYIPRDPGQRKRDERAAVHARRAHTLTS